jgi:hypothetical protein
MEMNPVPRMDIRQVTNIHQTVERVTLCFDKAQHERKIINDFLTSPFALSRVEG